MNDNVSRIKGRIEALQEELRAIIPARHGASGSLTANAVSRSCKTSSNASSGCTSGSWKAAPNCWRGAISSAARRQPGKPPKWRGPGGALTPTRPG